MSSDFNTTLKGHCWCGRNTFEIVPKPLAEKPYYGSPPQAYYCHCEDCRRAASSPLFLWVKVPLSWVTFSQVLRESDDPNIEKDAVFKPYSSKPGIERRFCGFCGTQLTWASLKKDPTEAKVEYIDISAGAFSEEDGQRLREILGDISDVNHHFYYKSGLKWWQDELKGSKWANDGVKHPMGDFHETMEE